MTPGAFQVTYGGGGIDAFVARLAFPAPGRIAIPTTSDSTLIVLQAALALSVSHSGTSVSINLSASPYSCNFGGTYSQQGKLGKVSGTYTCTDGSTGTFMAFDMTPTVNGFNGHVIGQNQYCQWSGFVGGIVRVR